MNRLHTLSVERAGLPRVTLAQRVVDTMVRGALIYQTETGKSLIGLPIPAVGRHEPDLFVLDTIAPDDSAVRRGAYFEQGDDLQGDIFNWLSDNWDDMRVRPDAAHMALAHKARWNVPLAHLGDWHKHPGTLTEPSWGDTDTAIQSIFDEESGNPYLLAILATVWDRDQAHALDENEAQLPGETPLKIDIDPETTVRLDCWYISRRTRRFVHLTPTVAPNDTLPTLPAVAWHLSSPERARQEIEALTKAGYAVSLEELDADKTPPRELCITLARRGSDRILIAVTQATYPSVRPELRSVPLKVMAAVPEGTDLFPALWAASAPLSAEAYPTWAWDTTRTLCELVQAVEAKGVNATPQSPIP